jgi:hypothetical protein
VQRRPAGAQTRSKKSRAFADRSEKGCSGGRPRADPVIRKARRRCAS